MLKGLSDILYIVCNNSLWGKPLIKSKKSQIKSTRWQLFTVECVTHLRTENSTRTHGNDGQSIGQFAII